MAHRIEFRRRPIRSKAAGRILNDEVRKELKVVAQSTANKLNSYVADWDSNIRFRVKATYATENRILMSVEAEGDALAIQRWNMVDSEGREGGAQIPKGNIRKPMRFQVGYARKTKIGVVRPVAPGERYGAWVSKWAVKQGEVKPAHLTEIVKRSLIEPTLDRRLNSARERAVRKFKNASRPG